MSGFNLSHDHVSHSKPAEPLAEPLGLTVHSMPVPGQGVAMPGASRKGGRLKMLIVLLVCAAPVIASYFAYYVVRPEGRRNFGELITPQRPVIDAQAVTLNGTSVALPTLKGQWLLISVASGLCDVKCEKQLYLQRQVLTGLGKDRDRFDWVWLISDNQAVHPALLPGLKDAVLLRLPLDQVARWLSPAPGQQLSDHLYVVDPMGNWMMRFPADLNADGALKAKKDLERLLRASASWDQAGREGK